MAGFFSELASPSAISYYPDAAPIDWRSEKYFYVTRRTMYDSEKKKSLICAG